MKEVTGVYKGYLELIKYLEEKFPGCVQRVFPSLRKISTPRKELLLIKPTSTTTAEAFIQPACDKFNAL